MKRLDEWVGWNGSKAGLLIEKDQVLIEQRFSANCKKVREYVYLINTDKEINSVRVTCNQRVINEQIFRLMVAKLVCNTQAEYRLKFGVNFYGFVQGLQTSTTNYPLS